MSGGGGKSQGTPPLNETLNIAIPSMLPTHVNYSFCVYRYIVNARRACAREIYMYTVVTLSVCVSVCVTNLAPVCDVCATK